MNHRRTGFARQFPIGNQCRHRRGRDRLTAFVDNEAAISVAIECQTDVSTGFAHIALQIHQVGRLQRIGLVIGKRPVEFEIQRQHGDGRDRAQDGRRGVAGHSIAGVDGDPQRSQSADIHQRPQKQ